MLDFLEKYELKPSKLHENIEFLIDGILPKKLITIIYANGGSGKSFLALSLAKKLLENEAIKKIVYIDLDNPLNVLVDRRIEELISSKLSYIHRSSLEGKMPLELINLLAERALGNAYEGVVFILDSLRNFIDIDNDSKAMGLMNALMNIREAGGSVLALHHSNKDGRNFKGSNQIYNSADCMFELERLEGLNVQLSPKKERVGLKKQALSINPFSLDIKEVDARIVSMSERERVFVKSVKEILGDKELAQSQILLALGYEKDHQWARKTLGEFEGVFWECRVEKNKKLFCLMNEVSPLSPHSPQADKYGLVSGDKCGNEE